MSIREFLTADPVASSSSVLSARRLTCCNVQRVAVDNQLNNTQDQCPVTTSALPWEEATWKSIPNVCGSDSSQESRGAFVCHSNPRPVGTACPRCAEGRSPFARSLGVSPRVLRSFPQEWGIEGVDSWILKQTRRSAVSLLQPAPPTKVTRWPDSILVKTRRPSSNASIPPYSALLCFLRYDSRYSVAGAVHEKGGFHGFRNLHVRMRRVLPDGNPQAMLLPEPAYTPLRVRCRGCIVVSPARAQHTNRPDN